MLKKKITFCVLTILLSSCSSIKLADNWKSGEFNETKKEKILVVARGTDIEVRKVYEEEMVLKLKAEGINAIAAYKLFPTLKENKNVSEEETNKIVSMLISDGIGAVLLTSLKDTKIQKPTPNISKKEDDLYASGTRIGNFEFSFRTYYNVHSVEYLTNNLRPRRNDNYSTENLSITNEFSSTTYVIETVLYNLIQEKDKQLVGVFVIEATDPKSAEQVLKGFTKIISKQFK